MKDKKLKTDPVAEDSREVLGKFSAFLYLQPIVRIALLAVILLCFFLGLRYPETVGSVLFGLAMINFLLLLSFRLKIIFRSFEQKSNPIGHQINSFEKPKFSILVPLKSEGSVIYKTFDAIKLIEYPEDKKEVLVLVEDTDQYTLSVIADYSFPSYFKLVKIPTKPPFTKARALQHGLNRLSGEIVTVFDAESRPEPLQFEKLIVEMQENGKAVCYQAKIRISNAHQNVLASFFAAEYEEWFENHLTQLTSRKQSFGLGGNSFYILTTLLKKVGGWDPYNVTEDAELSVRLIENNIDTRIFDSYTYESCPTNFNNWIHQRIRWDKGLLITQLIHIYRTWSIFGFKQWNVFWTRMLAGTLLPLSTLFVVCYFIFSSQILDKFPLLNFAVWIVLFLSIVISWISDFRGLAHLGIRNRFAIIWLGSLYYMILYIIAGILAYIEYFSFPSKWNKTHHEESIEKG